MMDGMHRGQPWLWLISLWANDLSQCDNDEGRRMRKSPRGQHSTDRKTVTWKCVFFGDITLVPFPMYILKDFSGIFRTLQWHYWHVVCWPFQESSPSVHVTCRCWLYRLRAAQLLHKLPPNATSHKVAEIGASWFHKCDCIQIGKDKIRCDQRWNIVLVALASGDTSLKWMDLENTSLYGINSHSIHKVI